MTSKPPYALALGCAPLIPLAVYLGHVYPQLPASLATTFDGAGNPVAFSSKQGWLGLTVALVAFVNLCCLAPLLLGLHRRRAPSPAYATRVERFMAMILFVINGLQLLWAVVLTNRSLAQPTFAAPGVNAALWLTLGAVVASSVLGFAYLRGRG